MNFRTTSIIFGTLICMLLVFGIVVQRNAPPDEGFLFPSLRQKADDAKINTVVIELDGQTYTLKEDADGAWTTQPPDSPEVWRIDRNKVNGIIDEVKRAQRNEEADVPQDEGRTGLGRPKVKVTLRGTVKPNPASDQTVDREWTLELGDKSADDANWFARSSERPGKIYAVQASSLKDLDKKDAKELRSRTLLEVTPTNAEALTIEKLDKGTAAEEVSFAKGKNYWRFTNPAKLGYVDFEGVAKEKEQPGLKKLLGDVADIRVDKVSDFVDLGRKSLRDFGLDKDNATMRIQVRRTEPGKKEAVTETLLVGDKVADAKDKDQSHYYVRMEKDNYVARVDAKQLDLLLQVLQDPKILRSRDLGFFTLDQPDAINVEWPARSKEVVKLRKLDESNWRMYTDGGTGYKSSKNTVEGANGLLDTLQGKGKIKKFFDETDETKLKALDKKLGFDNPSAEYSVYVDAVEGAKKKKEEKDKKADDGDEAKKKDNKDKDAKKDDKDLKEPKLEKEAKPVVKLIFGAKDEDNNWVYVKRITTIDGKELAPDRVAIPIEAYVKVTPSEGYLAFLDKELPGFKTENVKKLELVRDNEKFVLEKGVKPRETKKIKNEDLPKAIADAFKSAYPKATLKKAEEISTDGKASSYELEVADEDSKTSTVFYDPKGEFTKEAKKVKTKDLPEAVTKAVEERFPKAKIDKAQEIRTKSGKTNKVTSYDLDVTTEDKAAKQVTYDMDIKFLKDRTPDEVWLRKAPTDLEKLGVDEMNANLVVSRLEKLKVLKWVRKIDPKKDAELKEFGLKEPGVTATLYLKKEAGQKADEKKDDKGEKKDDGKGKDDKKDAGKDDKKGTDKKTDDKSADEYETRVFQFGKEGKIDKAKGYYALVSGTDIVFLAEREVTKFLQTVELRGREVVKFEPDRVRELKVKGWYKLYDGRQTFRVTRKNAKDTWKVETPEDFELDPAKVTNFLQDLSRLQAMRYVATKAGSEDKYGLTGKDTLEITVLLAKKSDKEDKDKDDKDKKGKDKKGAKDDKDKNKTDKDQKEEMDTPVKLTIGSLKKEEDESIGYYAMVDSLPGVIFLVPKDEFRIVDEGLKFFKEKKSKIITE